MHGTHGVLARVDVCWRRRPCPRRRRRKPHQRSLESHIGPTSGRVVARPPCRGRDVVLQEGPRGGGGTPEQGARAHGQGACTLRQSSPSHAPPTLPHSVSIGPTLSFGPAMPRPVLVTHHRVSSSSAHRTPLRRTQPCRSSRRRSRPTRPPRRPRTCRPS